MKDNTTPSSVGGLPVTPTEWLNYNGNMLKHETSLSHAREEHARNLRVQAYDTLDPDDYRGRRQQMITDAAELADFFINGTVPAEKAKGPVSV